jgi:hypothetical protein
MLAHRKKWLFCKVTPVSIQTFVEGLLRLTNVLEATNGTLKNVNNICSLAINSTKYFVLFSMTLLVYDDECCICLQHLQRLSPHEWLLPIVVLGLDISARTNRFLRLFGCLKATMGGSGKTLDSLDFFSTDVQCSRMVLKLFLRQGWYVRTQGVLLYFCFSLYWSKLLLEILWALLKLFLIILCL